MSLFSLSSLSSLSLKNLGGVYALGVVGALVVGTSTSAVAQQQLVAAQSSVEFTAKQMGVPLQGHFKKFEAQFNFDPAKPESSRIRFSVDTGSATMGARETDAELPKATWFNVAKFPQAIFESSSVKALGKGQFQVAGKLTIKGQSQDVQLPVTLAASGSHTIASGELPIKRLHFKIGENEWADTSMVADEVRVQFKLALSGVAKL